MIERAFVAASAVVGIGVLIAMTAHRTPVAIACSGSPERIEEPVRAADVIAIVRAEAVGSAVNAAPTIQPTFTPFPQATPQPYPSGDFTGVGANVHVVRSLAGSDVAGQRIIVDGTRRAALELDEREWESVWPGTVRSNCGLDFQLRYEAGATYIALLEWSGDEYETQWLLKVEGDNLDPNHQQAGFRQGVTVSLATYERYFSDIEADVYDGVPDEYDYAYIARPAMPVERVVGFMQAVRGDAIAPPETGSAGLR